MNVNEILHGASHTKDMRWYYELRTLREKLRTQRPYLEPASHVPSFVITRRALPVAVRNIEKSLQRIHRDFRIICDPLTALDGMPCYHLYTEVPNGFCDGVSKLVLEFSIQRDPTKAWPLGGPCTPGKSLVSFVRSVMKHEDKQRRAKWQQRIIDEHDALQRGQQQMQEYLYRDFFRPYWVGGRVVGSLGSATTRGRTMFHHNKDRVKYFTPGRTGDHKSKVEVLRDKYANGKS